MSFDQVRMLAAVILFLAAVITAMWGTEIAGAAAGAWGRGTAQAAAEKRRLSNAAHGARQANSSGRGLSGAFQQAKATAGSMKGAAKGASTWARKEGGPVRRIAAAAATGAYVGARGAARAAAGAKRQATKTRGAAGGGYKLYADNPRTVRGMTAAGARYAAAAVKRRASSGRGRPGSGRGSSSGARRRWRPRHLGVCDGCGVTVARASLQRFPLGALGEGLGLLLCFLCRRKHAPQAPAGPSVTGTSSPRAVPSPAAGALPASADSSTGAGTAPTGTSTPVPATPLPGAPAPAQSLPAADSAPGDLPAAASGPARIDSPTGRQALMPEGRPAVGYSRPAGNTVAIAGAGTVAVRSEDGTTHGAQNRVAEDVIAAAEKVRKLVFASVEHLTAENASESQIRDMAAWADSWWKFLQEIESGLAETNRRLDPYVDSVLTAGGPSEVADAAYHSDY